MTGSRAPLSDGKYTAPEVLNPISTLPPSYEVIPAQ